MEQSKLLNIHTPTVTFDQPLWIKAVEISSACSINIVCRLGGFHMLMNFIGAIGTLMEGSGFSEALQQCYGTNTVIHNMVSGKAISRALRGYFLMSSSLTVLLLQTILESDDLSDTG